MTPYGEKIFSNIETPMTPYGYKKTQNLIYWDQPHMNHYDPIAYEFNILVVQAWPWTQYSCDLDTIPTWTIMDHDHLHDVLVI